MHEIYKHNWFNRNTDTFVYGPSVSINKTFSSLVYSESDANKFISNYDLFANEIETMVYQRFNKRINIKISDTSDNTYTDGKYIVINSQKQINNIYERIDLIFGLAFHEVAHCLFTDFNILTEKHIFCNPILKEIHNILEDEEIENRITKQNIGYGKYLAKCKRDILGKEGCSKEVILQKKVNSLDEILTIFFCIIRYPKYISLIDDNILNKYTDLFIKINNILINKECPAVIPYVPCSMYEDSYYDNINITNATVAASFEIYKYISEYFGAEFIKQKEECENDNKSFINSTVISSFDSNTNEQISNEFNCIINHDDIYSGNNNGSNVSISNDRVRFPNIERYNKFYNSIKEYIPEVSKIIIPNNIGKKDVLQINRFRRNGSLDTNRLADAMQNINTVYNQRIIDKQSVTKCNPKYAFVIMIDESGSMKTYDRRNEFAFKTAILFYEVLSKFKDIEIYIYGHGDVINSYITKERKNKFVLGNFDCQGSQNDEYSYNWIINDVKRQTNLPIVILNITDFYYCSDDYKMSAMFDNFRKTNISFNMLNLGRKHTPREIAICKRMLEGQVVPINDIQDTNLIRDAYKQLSTMIVDNYKKFNK